ncbi:hypothetical protein [Malacoplasma iowae]|uniref:hypothetical protein n=1 Tax=Malacoplasma iowae TaxID=2116 RepID=UPI001E496472|nr:hypothetical protein [Malacoplasma iowae]
MILFLICSRCSKFDSTSSSKVSFVCWYFSGSKTANDKSVNIDFWWYKPSLPAMFA